MADGDLVDAFYTRLQLASAAWLVAIALKKKTKQSAASPTYVLNRDILPVRTFALFLRHSVQALGVTIPRPRLRLEFWAEAAAAGRVVPCDVVVPGVAPEPEFVSLLLG